MNFGGKSGPKTYMSDFCAPLVAQIRHRMKLLAPQTKHAQTLKVALQNEALSKAFEKAFMKGLTWTTKMS